MKMREAQKIIDLGDRISKAEKTIEKFKNTTNVKLELVTLDCNRFAVDRMEVSEAVSKAAREAAEKELNELLEELRRI